MLIAIDLDAWVPGQSQSERGRARVRGGQDRGTGHRAVGMNGGSIVTDSLEERCVPRQRPRGWSRLVAWWRALGPRLDDQRHA